MKRTSPFALLLATALPWATAALAQPLPTIDTAGAMHDSHGLTLYTYDADTTPGTSDCNGPCAALWPPSLAPADATPAAGFSIITRSDGHHQWAYHGKPLYRYVADHAPHDARGDGVNGRWHVAYRAH